MAARNEVSIGVQWSHAAVGKVLMYGYAVVDFTPCTGMVLAYELPVVARA